MNSALLKQLMFRSKQAIYVFIIQCLAMQLLWAESGNGQDLLKDTDITLQLEMVTLEGAFQRIEQVTSFNFSFGQRVLQDKSLISIKFRKADLRQVLEHIASQSEYNFRRINNTIYVIPRARKQPVEVSEEFALQTISGKVTDAESGEPIAGVNVVVSGSSVGTITDVTGAYTVEVPESTESLTFSFVGYQAIEIQIGDRSVIDVKLSVDLTSLEEIVVVGYGTQRKSDFTGSIASVPKARLDKVPNLNVAQVIQGSIPGVNITTNQAGAASSESIIIRGRNSILASNEPLIIVDRVPFSGQLRDINVHDIESIEILRDASATAIYGSRGANGVVLITTKSGKGGKPSISYDGRFAAQRFDRLPNYMNGQEFYDFKELREPGNLTATEEENFASGNYTDWQRLGIRPGNSQQHNLSVSGGTDKINYYFGGNLLDVKGVTKNDDYERITGRVNLDVFITDWLSIGTRSQYAVDDRSGVELDFSDLGRKNPLINPYDEFGNITIYPWPEFTDIGNPLEPLNYENLDESRQLLSNNFILIEFPFLKGLSYRSNFGINERFVNVSTYRGRNTKVGLEAGGTASTERTQIESTIVENILDYQNTFTDHAIGVTALYSYQKDQITSNHLVAEGFPNDITSYYNAAQAQVLIPSYQFNRTDLISTMLRLNYGYKQKYLLTLTGRRDGYSGFGVNDKWGDFGTIAGAWILSRENFFPLKDVFNFFKFRVSYGENGNQAVAPYQSIARFREENFVNGSTSLAGFVPDNLANPLLGWETSSSTNFGLDFGILDNLLTGTIDYFNTKTEDLLLNRTISPIHGIGSIVDNIGETKNTGLEFSLNTALKLGEHFNWNANFNFTHLNNEIISLGLGENGEVDDVASGLFIGEPITSNFDFLFNGVWQSDEADQASSFNTEPGNIKIKDVNNDGQITADDRTIIGQTDPQNLWGLTNTFSYKDFSLILFVHGVHGVTKENRLFQDGSSSSGVRRNVILKNWWTPDNPTNEFYQNAVGAGGQQGFGAPLYQNASFIRIKDITLSYSLPGNLVNKLGLSNVNLYFTGRNLFTITDWLESDPELNSGRGTIPLQKEYLFGLTIRN